MRILAVQPGPAFSVQDVYAGWVKALRKVADVQEFDLGAAMAFYEVALRQQVDDEDRRGHDSARMASKALRAAVFDWWPDVLLICTSFFVDQATYDICRARRIKVVTLFTESPYEDDSQVAIAAHCDLAVLNDPTNLDRFAEVTQAMFLPHAYDPDIHKPRPLPSHDHRSDLAFVGTGYPSRIEFLERCHLDGIDVALAGNWQQLTADSPLRKFVAHDIDHCVANEDAQLLYAGCHASVNLYRTEASRPALSQGWAMGPREVELAASGTFFLTEPRGENREVLPMVPTFVGPEDFSDQLRWWLDHDAERLSVAAAARGAVAGRTFDVHARSMLSALGV